MRKTLTTITLAATLLLTGATAASARPIDPSPSHPARTWHATTWWHRTWQPKPCVWGKPVLCERRA